MSYLQYVSKLVTNIVLYVTDNLSVTLHQQ